MKKVVVEVSSFTLAWKPAHWFALEINGVVSME